MVKMVKLMLYIFDHHFKNLAPLGCFCIHWVILERQIKVFKSR